MKAPEGCAPAGGVFVNAKEIPSLRLFWNARDLGRRFEGDRDKCRDEIRGSGIENTHFSLKASKSQFLFLRVERDAEDRSDACFKSGEPCPIADFIEAHLAADPADCQVVSVRAEGHGMDRARLAFEFLDEVDIVVG